MKHLTGGGLDSNNVVDGLTDGRCNIMIVSERVKKKVSLSEGTF